MKADIFEKEEVPDVQHAGSSLGQHKCRVDEVGDGQENDQNRGGV